MRTKIITFLKTHTNCLHFMWGLMSFFLNVCKYFVPKQPKTILFASFGGRKFDDSPKAIYDEICLRKEFDDWRLVWAFVDPDEYDLPRGEKVKIDTVEFFKVLLSSRVWVSNSGMTRGIKVSRKDVIRIETWHGAPIKKIGGEEHQNTIARKKKRINYKLDSKIIRCAQSDYDLQIFKRIFSMPTQSFFVCDLPRNDSLLKYTEADCKAIRKKLNIPANKRVILYAPTYREFSMDEHKQICMKPPIDLKKWETALKDDYVLLVRAHYAVTKSLNLSDSEFIRDVSGYSPLNDLYAVSDIMVSDYSSTFFDFSIMERPMFCFAYDLEEYELKRGLYLNLEEALPCPIDKTEEELLKHILTMDEEKMIRQTIEFKNKYVPNAGKASKTVVDEITRRL